MKKKPLSPEQAQDALRLRLIYDQKKKDLGLSQEVLAEKLGVSQSAVAQIMSGKNALNLKRAVELATILGVEVEQFSPSLAKEAEQLAYANGRYAGPYEPGKKYPVLSSVQAGAWSEACEPYSLKDIDLWLESNAHMQGEGFWLKVEGDSMTAPIGMSIPEGTYVLFDTGREAVNGSLVIAKLDDSNEATFKKLVIDGGQKYLKGLNPQWPLVPVNGNCRIIGVGIQTTMLLV
ncbi:LexA family protein [Pantoea dispersa]|uniref:LexA family protein n=1 Tax=Pantoea dispersa TaxID=59814 RepID=UPI000FDB0668|nr:LexA family transcriptional regulator [Pantoea dispersa]MDR6298247.1 SOS-response transcriptional repressor LexA [Pantoea dispersa]RVU75172.1 LexA family transcriptional regulator [Pantoea dispersa]